MASDARDASPVSGEAGDWRIEVTALAGLAILALAVLARIELVMRPAGSAGGDAFANSALFPGGVAAAILILVALRATRVLRAVRVRTAPAISSGGAVHPWRTLACLGTVALFVLVLPWLGFVASAAVLTALAVACVGGAGLWSSLALVVLAPVGVWFTFETLLGVILPYGRLWDMIGR